MSDTPDESSAVTIRLRTLADLFETPPRDPWRDGAEPIVGGVAQALALCRRGKARHARRLIIEVEEPSAGAELAARAPQAWKNHCLAMAKACREAAAARRTEGRRAFMSLLPVIAIALALSAFFDHAEPLPLFLNRIFSEGFIVLGWVLLWRPIELFFFDAGEPGVRRIAFERMAALQVEIAPVRETR